MHVLHLKAFLYWFKDRKQQGIDLYNYYNEDWGQLKLEASIVMYEHYKEELENAEDKKTKAPEKFQLHSLWGWSMLN